MISKIFEEKVRLLVDCLPAILKEECFAIKGGTAINLFCYDLPRLSVDIDLVYLPIEDRDTTYLNIHKALEKISNRLRSYGLTVVSNKKSDEKLVCYNEKTNIKIEPNYTLRGYIFEPSVMEVCPKVKEQYSFSKAKIISHGELWGGKICAALDRQHPRDLFDIRNLFKNEGITDNIKKGFLTMLLSENRPIHEILNPNFQIDKNIFVSEFDGMTDEYFNYEEAETTFFELKKKINSILTKEDKDFLTDFTQLKADFSKCAIPNLDQLPGIKWKLINLEKLKKSNLEKFEKQYQKLLELF